MIGIIGTTVSLALTAAIGYTIYHRLKCRHESAVWVDNETHWIKTCRTCTHGMIVEKKPNRILLQNHLFKLNRNGDCTYCDVNFVEGIHKLETCNSCAVVCKHGEAGGMQEIK